MPPGKEGSLSADEVYALTAFLLYRNGIIQETDVLDASSLPRIRMPNRNNFVPLWPDWNRKPGRFGIYP
jgi:cytochrome c